MHVSHRRTGAEKTRFLLFPRRTRTPAPPLPSRRGKSGLSSGQGLLQVRRPRALQAFPQPNPSTSQQPSQLARRKGAGQTTCPPGAASSGGGREGRGRGRSSSRSPAEREQPGRESAVPNAGCAHRKEPAPRQTKPNSGGDGRTDAAAWICPQRRRRRPRCPAGREQHDAARAAGGRGGRRRRRDYSAPELVAAAAAGSGQTGGRDRRQAGRLGPPAISL